MLPQISTGSFSKNQKQNERKVPNPGFEGKIHFMIILQLRCWFLYLEKVNAFCRKTLLYGLETIQKLDSLKFTNI